MRTLSKTIFLAAILALMASITVAGPAIAARGGANAGGKTTAALAVYQYGAPVGSVALQSDHEVRGAGLGANKTVYVGLQGYFGLTPVVTDGAGGFSLAEVAPGLPGTYTYVVLVYKQNAWQVAASVTFSVT